VEIKKIGRGGRRPGAGRKPTDKPTRTISFRIPEEHVTILADNGIDNPAAFYRQAGERALKKFKALK
jgi:hypothetical protein